MKIKQRLKTLFQNLNKKRETALKLLAEPRIEAPPPNEQGSQPQPK